MKQHDKWVLVANSCSARIFHLKDLHTLVELKDFVHPEGHLHEQDLVDNGKPGRDFSRMGPERHAYEPKMSQKDQECRHFAKTLSNYLQDARSNNQFAELIIIASPGFLGELRQAFNTHVAGSIKKEINKDLVHLSTSEILKQITE